MWGSFGTFNSGVEVKHGGANGLAAVKHSVWQFIRTELQYEALVLPGV